MIDITRKIGAWAAVNGTFIIKLEKVFSIAAG
jgi:hypothetical protein